MKFSIITACYNSSKYIREAVQSLNRQSIRCIEHIIIDGGSSDETLSVLYSMNLPYQRLISEPDTGIYDALNKGLNISTNEIIGILHSDDMFEDDHVLEDVLRLFNEGADVVYGDLCYVDRSNTSKVVRRWKSGRFHPLDLQFGWMPPHPAFFLKRELLNDVGSFDLKYKISADYDHMLRILCLGKVKTSYLPRSIVKMRLGGVSNRSLTSVFHKTFEDIKICQSYFRSPVGTVICKNLRKLPQLKLL